ncbi:adenosylmethionine decarboxylase [Pseudonocardia sp. CA-107938]|uniref:adenosylmethionine decarboxylase n=1 Tax=Pseudonocardia sp. CA-107938 TaxID=3240021 RepID=UPI003D8F82B3
MSFTPVGRHVLAELSGVDADLLDDAATLRTLLTDALVAAGARVLQVVDERFHPQGATVVAVLAESHASLHTWPEHGRAHVDVYTCGDSADPVKAVHLLAGSLHAGQVHVEVVERGGGPRVVTEPISAGVTRRWALGTVRHAGRTDYQDVLIADTTHGVTLFCDDERQSAADTQLVYHEALFGPAALLADHRDRVLVIGSSEGVVSQLALAAGARVVDHVDIDRDCVRACAQHLPYGYTPTQLDAAERGDGPVRVHYADGLRFVEDCQASYDVVVVDLPDERPDQPDAQLNRLYTVPFLKRCADLLTDGGVVVSQAGSPAMWRDGTLRAAWHRFHDVFAQVVPYVSDEHEWAFLCGRRVAVPDPAGLMIDRLGDISWRPTSLDAAALRARTVAPMRVRAG